MASPVILIENLIHEGVQVRILQHPLHPIPFGDQAADPPSESIFPSSPGRA